MSNGGNKDKCFDRRQRSIYKVHYDIQPREEMAIPLLLPSASCQVTAYDKQVAGHRETKDTRYLGLLKCSNGTILKPILKEAQRREVEFYNRVSTATEPELVELRNLIPKYFGCTKYTYNGHELEYIILEDLTKGMLEPCIMDVKIGRKTYDHLASEEKIKSEESKYAQCKREYGFCIPGFQVYSVDTGKLCTYNKEYGKKLHGEAVKKAIRKYMNVSVGACCRSLSLQLLSGSWRAQRWARAQRGVSLRAASLLLAYDAAALRDCCPGNTQRCVGLPVSSDGLCDYTDTLCRIRRSYRAALHRLTATQTNTPPVVKIIDFAHAFFNDDCEQIDENFRDGIDSFVSILEEILDETDHNG